MSSEVREINETVYVPQNIRDKWKKYGLDAMWAFLQDGLEFMELFAEFDGKAMKYLEKRPLLKEVLT